MVNFNTLKPVPKQGTPEYDTLWAELRERTTNMVRVNFSGVQASADFPVLEKGRYAATITEATLEEGPKGEYIKLTFDLSDAPGKQWRNMSLSEKSLWFVKRTMLRLELATEEELEADEFDIDERIFIGCDCVIQVGIKMYEGKEQNEVKDILSRDALDGETSGGASTGW